MQLEDGAELEREEAPEAAAWAAAWAAAVSSD